MSVEQIKFTFKISGYRSRSPQSSLASNNASSHSGDLNVIVARLQ